MSQKKPLQNLYDELTANGEPLPDYATFEAKLTAPGEAGYKKRAEFHEALKNSGYNVPDYDTFRDTLFKPQKRKAAASGQQRKPNYDERITMKQAEIDAAKKQRQNFIDGGDSWLTATANNIWNEAKEVGQSAWESVTGQDGRKRRAKEYADKMRKKQEYDDRIYDLETQKRLLEYDKEEAETNAAIDAPKKPGEELTEAEKADMLNNAADLKAGTAASAALGRDRLNVTMRNAGLQVKPARIGGHSKTARGALAWYDQNGGAHKTRTEADWANADIDENGSLQAQIEKAEKDLADLKALREQADNKPEERAKDAVIGVMGALTGSPLSAPIARAAERLVNPTTERNLYAAAERKAEERLETLKDEQARRRGEDEGFSGAAWNTATDSRTWDMGYQDLRDGLAALNAMEADNLTPEQEKARRRYIEAAGKLLEERARYGENEGWRKRAGAMGAQMIPFALQFAATGGGSLVTKGVGKAVTAAVTKAVGKKTAAKIAQKAVRNAVTRGALANNAAAKEVAAKIGENGLKGYIREAGVKQAAKDLTRWTADKGLRTAGTVADDIAKSAAMTGTVQSMQTAADIIDRRMGKLQRNARGEYEYKDGKSWGDAAWQGEANAIIENFSEMFGTHLDPLLGAKNAARVAKVFGAGRISRMLGGEGARKALQASDGISRMLKKAGLSDYFGETAEEYYGQALRTLLDLDDAYFEDENGDRVNNFKSAKFHTDIIGGMALTMLIPAAAKGAAGAKGYLSAKRQLGIEDRNARGLLGDEVWEELRGEFREAEGDGIADFLANVATREDLDAEQKRAVRAYAYTSLSLRGYDMAAARTKEADKTKDKIAERLQAAQAAAAQDLDEETAASVNNATGKTRTATMQDADGGEKTVQVVGGSVTVREDGTVDRAKSDKTVVVRDPETGEEKFADAHRLWNVSGEETPMPRYAEQDRVTLADDWGGTLSGVIVRAENGVVTVRLDEALNGSFYQEMPAEEFAARARSLSRSYEGEERELWKRETPQGGLETSETSEDTRETETRDGTETESGREPRAVSALARIPKDEKTGEPKWESADAVTAREGLIEQCEGDADLAARVMSAQAAQAEAAVKRLRKNAPKPKKVQARGTVSQMIAAEKSARELYEKETLEYRAQLEAAEKTAEFWQSVHALEQESRRVANRERRAREITASRERREQSKAAAFTAGEAVTEKWNAAPKIGGAEHEVILADGTVLQGRYVLTEAGAVSASHDANRGFGQTEGFPHDENGETVNDRDYRGDRQAQEAVRRMAARYDGRAAQSPVVASAEGVVLSGNNRTMSGDLAAAQGTDGAYVEYLTRNAGRYGFTAEQVGGMAHPRVVFVTEAALPYTAETFAAFNAETQKKMSKPEQAVKLGKTIPEAAFRRIVAAINRYDSLSDFYADGEAVTDTLRELLDAGVINEMQLPELITGGNLSALGRELLENSLIGKAFQNSPDAVRQLVADGAMRQSVVMALGEIARNRSLAGGYDLADELAAAVDLVSRAKAEDPKGYGRGNSVARFAAQAGLFDEELGDSRVTDACTVLLADTLNGSKPSGLRKVLAVYNNEADAPARGEMDMFAGEIRSKEEVLTDVIRHFSDATREEQEALERQAVGERKRLQREEDERGGAEQVAPVAESRESGGGVEEQTAGLTDAEADELMSEMEAAAAPAPQLELTPENWAAEFGDDGMVETPIGGVKMGGNQMEKLAAKGRAGQFGMIKPTLEEPQVIMEVPSEEEGAERGSVLLFVRAFIGKDGKRIYYFKSVTVKKDGLEVSVSSHYDREKRVREALKKGKLLYRFDGGAQTEHRPADVSVTTSPEVERGLSSAGKVSETSENAQGKAEESVTDRGEMTKRAEELAKKLHTPVKIITAEEEAEKIPDARKRRAKGYFDPRTGTVTVIVPNHENMADVENTMLHEAVGHDGFRLLFPSEEVFGKALDELYTSSDAGVMAEIDRKAEELWKKEGGAGKMPPKDRLRLRRLATEEYGAELCGRIGYGGFEAMTEAERGFWGEVRAALERAFERLRRLVGVRGTREWSDKEWAFVYREAYKLKRNGGVPRLPDLADTVAGRAASGFDRAARSESGDVMYREGTPEEREEALARDAYERRLRSGWWQSREALQDSMLSLRTAMEEIMRASGMVGRVEDVKGYENAYLGENRLSSVNKAEWDKYERELLKPLLNAVHLLTGKAPEAYGALVDYMFAKHGLERNAVLARRDAKKAAEKKYGEKARAAERRAAAFDKVKAERAEKYGRGVLTEEEAAKFAAARAEAADLKKSMAALEEAEFAKNRKRDYSGLTALAETKDLAEAEKSAADMVAAYEGAHDTAELWARVNAANAAELEKQFRSGMMSRAVYEHTKGMFRFYIPLRGFDEKTSAEEYAYLDDRKRGGGAKIRKAAGRMSKADDPFAAMSYAMQGAIMQGNRNSLVKQTFLAFAMDHPSDLVSVGELWLRYDAAAEEWVETVCGDLEGTERLETTDSPEEVARKTAAFKSAAEKLAKRRPDLLRRQKELRGVPYRVVGDMTLKEHQVDVYLGGEVIPLTVNGNPRLAQALKGQTNPVVEEGKSMLGAMTWVNRQLSAFYTTRNPDFIASNFCRDAIYANSSVYVKEDAAYAWEFNKNWGALFAGKGEKRLMFTLFRKLRQGTLDMTRPTERMFAEFIANGGETGYSNVRDIEAHKKAVRKALRRAGAGVFNARDGKVGMAGFDAVCDRLDEYNRAVENLARFAAYITSRERGRSVERSVYDAKEISVNFNKKGSGSRFYGAAGQTWLGNKAAYLSGACRALFVFWNAAIQGSTNFARLYRRSPGDAKTAAFSIFCIGAGVAAAGAAGGDGGDGGEDDYFNLPENVRRSNLLLGYGGGWVSLPLPVEYRAIYGLGELAGGLLFGGQRMGGAELATAVTEQLSQLMPIDFMEGGGSILAFAPSAFKPLAEVGFNTSWTGLPVHRRSDWNENDPEAKRAFRSTNAALVAFSRAVNAATGGNEHKRGWLENLAVIGAANNPAVQEHLLTGYLGGMAGFVNRVTKTAGMMTGSREWDAAGVPVINRLWKHSNERTAYRSATNICSQLAREGDELQRLLSRYRKDTATGVKDWSSEIRELLNSEEFRRAAVYDKYRGRIDGLKAASQDDRLTEAERERYAAELNETRRAAAEEVSRLEK